MSVSSSRNLKRYNYLIGELEAAYHDASKKFGMSDSTSKILYAIGNEGGSCLLSDLCRQTGLSKQTVNSSLRNLEEEGIVYLEAVDGKSKKVFFSDKGREFASTTALRIIEIENEIFDEWTDEEITNYLRLTEKFLINLKEKIGKI